MNLDISCITLHIFQVSTLLLRGDDSKWMILSGTATGHLQHVAANMLFLNVLCATLSGGVKRGRACLFWPHGERRFAIQWWATSQSERIGPEIATSRRTPTSRWRNSLPLYNFNYCHLPLARLSQNFGKVWGCSNTAATRSVRSTWTGRTQVVSRETPCLEVSRRCSMVYRVQNGIVLQACLEIRRRRRSLWVGCRRYHASALDQFWRADAASWSRSRWMATAVPAEHSHCPRLCASAWRARDRLESEQSRKVVRTRHWECSSTPDKRWLPTTFRCRIRRIGRFGVP